MAQESDLDSHDRRPRPASSERPPVGSHPAPLQDRTIEAEGAVVQVNARANDSTLEAGVKGSTPAPSSDRLAMLTAHLPSVPRDAYAVGPQVARGGIGRVMMARDQRLDRPVAIKELLVRSEAQVQRFVREAALTARLQHPAIVPIYEAGRWSDGEPFYAMKLVSGRTLSDLIDEKRTLAERLSLLPHVLTVAQAIAYAHSQRILHRDLKPANVLVGEFGETVVIDWGLAKGLVDDDPPTSVRSPAVSGDGLTLDGAVVGTPAYMPPEQAAGAQVDERADVYAIGAMLYHLIAAVPPYHDVSWQRLFAMIATEAPRPLEEHAPTISDELCAIVNKAMARDPAARYQTAKALADDLHRFQTGQIVAAHTYSTARLLRRFWQRNRTALSIAASAIAFVTAVVIGAFVETEAQRQTALARGLEAEEARNVADEARKVADEARAAAEAAARQATARADDMTLLRAQDALARDPNEALAWLKALSPSFSNTREVRRLASDARARGISRAFRGHTGHVNDVVALPDGTRFVSASDDGTVRIWDVATATSRVLTGHTDEVWRVVPFPDGRRIVSASKDATARIWDTDTGAELSRFDIPSPPRYLFVRKDGSLVGCSTQMRRAAWVWQPGAASARLLGDPEALARCAVSQDGLRSVLEDKDGTVTWLETDSGRRHPMGTVVPVARGEWWMSADGRIALRGTTAPTGRWKIERWDLDTGQRRAFSLAGESERILLTKAGDRLIAAGAERVEIHDTKTGALVRRMPGHGAPINEIDMQDDEHVLISGGFDHSVRTWDLVTGETHSYAGLASVASTVDAWPDGRSVIAASSAGDVRLFGPGSGAALTDHKGPAFGLAVSAAGRAASIDDTGTLRITDVAGKQVAEHAVPAATGLRLVASPDRNRYAGAAWEEGLERTDPDPPGANKRAALVLGTFDADRPTLVQVPAQVCHIAWHPDGEAMFVALMDGTIQKVNLDGAVTEIDRLRALGLVLAVAPDGASLAVGSSDGLVRVIELATGRHRDLGHHRQAVSALAYSRAGLLASGSRDHTFRIWRPSDGTSRSFQASGGGVLHLGFSPDAQTLFVSNLAESSVRRWDVDSGEQLAPLVGVSGPLSGFTLSDDGGRVLARSVDGTSRLFDVATGKSRALVGHRDEVVAGAFTLGGKQIVTLGREGTVRAWPDDLPETMPELRAWLDAATPDRLEPR